MSLLATALSALVLAALPATAGAGDPARTSGSARWGADYFPNVPLVTHEGRTVHFFDDLVRDKVVLINFIYTSCPDACPLETAKLVEVQDLLGERLGRDVFFYSISIDPERDTPEKLREYSERFQTGPGWLFLTGAAADIRLLRQKVGMIAADETSLQDHSLNLLIGNQATGQWMKRSPFENPYFLVTQLEGSLGGWKGAPAPGPSYADAPALRQPAKGEILFRTRCSACHVIGAEDGLRRQGPNLLGVGARRERAWLVRWLMEPDAMLAERDPIATGLFEAYRGVPMPNMRLSEADADELLLYMEAESRWYAQATEPWEDPPPEQVGDGGWDSSSGVESARAPCCEKRELLVLDSGAAAEPNAEPVVELEPVVVVVAPGRLAEETRSEVAAVAGDPSRCLVLSSGLSLVLGLFAFLLGRAERGAA